MTNRVSALSRRSDTRHSRAFRSEMPAIFLPRLLPQVHTLPGTSCGARLLTRLLFVGKQIPGQRSRVNALYSRQLGNGQSYLFQILVISLLYLTKLTERSHVTSENPGQRQLTVPAVVGRFSGNEDFAVAVDVDVETYTVTRNQLLVQTAAAVPIARRFSCHPED